MRYLLGYKIGMTQVYINDVVVPVTIVKIPENVVCSVLNKDGHKLVRIGTGVLKKSSKAQLGDYKGLGFTPKAIWDVRSLDSDDFELGFKYSVDVLKPGDKLKITGITKAKGFAGVVKRWGFKGGPKTHGQSDRLRAPGSIGAGTDPGRVFPGKKMGGHMGGVNRSCLNRPVVEVGDDYILVKGPLPGNSGNLLKIEITSSNES
ncbi:MAG: 50S ribosomal protein L3 [Patescibacteria group bacterium]|nr:50S ribosomal protein L3 [Patescibacteria group bacterium]